MTKTSVSQSDGDLSILGAAGAIRCVAWLKNSELFPQMLPEVPADLEASIARNKSPQYLSSVTIVP